MNKGLFQEEGEYSLVIESVDETDTVAYSDVKNLNAVFVVDQTAPTVTVSGLEKNGRYRVQEPTVTMMPTDDGGKIKSFKVELLDADGKPLENDKGENISVRFDMAGDELTEYLSQHDGKASFTVPEGLDMQVAVTCEDYAVDAEGNTHTLSAVFDGITVSANAMVIFYANKPLFFGSIGGVTALIAGTAGILVWRKRRVRKA